MRPVVFDLEGTLVDFQWDLATGERRAHAALVDLGFPTAAIDGLDYAELYNTAVRRAEEFGVDEATIAETLDTIYDDCDADALDRWTLREGAESTLRRVSTRALVTNVGRAATEALLDRHGLSFDVVVTRNDVRLLKPDPTGLERAVEALGDDPLFVGDSLTDVRAGGAAGLDVAVVTGGESPDESLREAAPAHVLTSLRELPDWL